MPLPMNRHTRKASHAGAKVLLPPQVLLRGLSRGETYADVHNPLA